MANSRQATAVKNCLSQIIKASMEITQPDIMAEELRLASNSLFAVTGEVTPDDILGEIFAKFCIGK